MGRDGFETKNINNEITNTYIDSNIESGTESGTVCPVLAEIIELWPELTSDEREQVLAFVQSLIKNIPYEPCPSLLNYPN